MIQNSAIYRRFEKKLFYIPNWQIERTAYEVLIAYDKALLKKPQITPVHDILEFHIQRKYGVGIDFRDLQSEFPGKGVLGYYDFGGREICLDQALYEDKTVVGQRRCGFTVAHEIGHYLIQGRVLEGGLLQQSIFEKGQKAEDMIILEYRSTIDMRQEKQMNYLERQANHFAACLLMPENMVKQVMKNLGHPYPILIPRANIAGNGDKLFEHSYKFVRFSGIHDIFEVNMSAMAYRLVELGLVREEEIKKGMILKW